MTSDETLIEFPCDFQIKIIGKNSLLFAAEILTIARKHFPKLQDAAMSTRPSQHGNYLAISLNVYAQNQITLDALYLELTMHPDIKMVLW